MERTRRQGIELSGAIDVEDRDLRRGKERQLVDGLRGTGAAQASRTVGGHGDEGKPGMTRLEHGGQQLRRSRA